MNAKLRIVQNSAFNFMASVSQRIGQAFIFILVARTLTANDAGSYKLATTFTSILLTLSLWGLDQLFIRDVARKKNAADFFLNNFLLVRVLLAIFMWLGLAALLPLLPYPGDTKFLILIMTATIIPNSISLLYHAVWVTFENMKLISILMLFFSLLRLAGGGLILWQEGELLSIAYWFLLLSMVELITTIWITHRGLDLAFIGGHYDFTFIRHYLKLATPLIFVSFVLTIEYQLDNVILSFWSIEEVGLYGTAVTILTICLLLIRSFQLAAFPAISRAYKTSKIQTQKVYVQSVLFLLMVSFPVALLISVSSTQIVQLIFGSKYASAGPMLQVLIWAFFIAALNVPNSRMLIAANRQKTMALFALLSATGNILLSLWLVPRYGGMGSAWARVLAMPLYSIPALIYVQRHITQLHWRDFWQYKFKGGGK